MLNPTTAIEALEIWGLYQQGGSLRDPMAALRLRHGSKPMLDSALAVTEYVAATDGYAFAFPALRWRYVLHRRWDRFKLAQASAGYRHAIGMDRVPLVWAAYQRNGWEFAEAVHEAFVIRLDDRLEQTPFEPPRGDEELTASEVGDSVNADLQRALRKLSNR